jgi:DNA-binding NtrC family response regulator
VFPLVLLPLRERSGDIPLLVQHFVSKLSRRLNRQFSHIPSELMEALRLHDWPGNIRELQNVIERTMVLCDGPDFHLPPNELGHLVKRNTPLANRTLADAELDHIVQVLQQANGVVGDRMVQRRGLDCREALCSIGCVSSEYPKTSWSGRCFSRNSVTPCMQASEWQIGR